MIRNSIKIEYGIDTRKLSIGDILLTKNLSLRSKGIRLATIRDKTSPLSGGFSHAMIYIGGGLIAESTTDGLHKVCLSEFGFDKENDVIALTYRNSLKTEEKLKIVSYINANEGAEYSLRDARRSASKKKPIKPHSEDFFCSRLIHRSYDACQIKIGGEYSNPNDLLEEASLVRVEDLHFKKAYTTEQDVMDIERFTRIAIKELLFRAREKKISSNKIRNIQDLILLASSSQDADYVLCQLFDSIPPFKYYGMIGHGEFYDLISSYPDSQQRDISISNFTVDFEDYLRAIFSQTKGTKDVSKSMFERKMRSFYIEKITASITRFNDITAFMLDREKPSSPDGILDEMQDSSLKVISSANKLFGLDAKGLDDLVIESINNNVIDDVIFNIICNSELIYLPILYHNKLVDRWAEYKGGYVTNELGLPELVAAKFCRDISRYSDAYNEHGSKTAEILYLLSSYASTNYFSILIKSFESNIECEGFEFDPDTVLHITNERLDRIYER